MNASVADAQRSQLAKKAAMTCTTLVVQRGPQRGDPNHPFERNGLNMEKDANQRSPDSTTTFNPRKRRLIEEWDARSCQTPDVKGLPSKNKCGPLDLKDDWKESQTIKDARNYANLIPDTEFIRPYPSLARTPSAFSALEPRRSNLSLNTSLYAPQPLPPTYPTHIATTRPPPGMPINGFLSPREQTRNLIEIARHTLPGPAVEKTHSRDISPEVTLELARDNDSSNPYDPRAQNSFRYSSRSLTPPPPNQSVGGHRGARILHADRSPSLIIAPHAIGNVPIRSRHSPPYPLPPGGGTIHHLPKPPSPVRNIPMFPEQGRHRHMEPSPPLSHPYLRHSPPPPTHTITSGEYRGNDPREHEPPPMNGLRTSPHGDQRPMSLIHLPPDVGIVRESAFQAPIAHPQYPPSQMPHPSLIRNGHVRLSPELSERGAPPRQMYPYYDDSSISPSDSGCSSGRGSNPVSPMIDVPSNPVAGPSHAKGPRSKNPSGSESSTTSTKTPGSRNGERRGGRPSTGSRLNNLIPPDCPLTEEQIVDLDIDSFNDLMGKHHFSEESIAKYRDLRRKGKNRQAAKKSRQKKISELDILRQQAEEKKAALQEMKRQREIQKGREAEISRRIRLKKQWIMNKTQMDTTMDAC
ncbi:arginine-glutamic acid dipeptide repeats protein-like isoform X2 [Tigriopus californicus]|uniref:arginine-glutamic acid dipeptide repeats protein-like isoform X2 n=1 Tax=Tigriopus californicus TaxID=6832 RepID=UPI0027DA9E21|nr:arginine-glutamic acid dipeptide repeats protein-like isoform X2 [Tigriopus californicus]